MDEQFMDLISDINSSIEKIRETPSKGKMVSSFLDTNIPGVSGIMSLNLLFSDKIDVFIDKILDLFIMGDFSNVEDHESKLLEFLNKVGIKETSFQGKISKTIIDGIEKAVNSKKFMNSTSKIKKALIVLRELKRKRRSIDKEDKYKYDHAVKTLKSILKIISDIYKKRSLINDKFKEGLDILVNQ